MEAGIRNRVEIWADGGYRHAHDIVKLLCMGANRVGFGTLAMVSLGCTICRGCQLDTCHVGIATQIETDGGGAGARPQEVHAAGGRHRGRELRSLLHRDGRGGARAGRRDGLRARAGPGRPLRPARAGFPRRGARPRAADHAARGVPRARPGRPAGRRGRAGRGRDPRGGRPGAGAADPHGALGRLRPDRRAGGRRLRRHRGAPGVPPPDRRPRPRARHRARRGALAGAHLRRRRGGFRGRPRRARVQRRLRRRPGLRRVQRLGPGRSRRGRRPGRRRQDDAGRNRLDHEGPKRRGRAGQRLGRQVVRLRRSARPALRSGLRGLPVLHPPLRRRRGPRRRAGPAARRLARVPGRSRERQGLRVRVHDVRAAPSCSATSAPGPAPE